MNVTVNYPLDLIWWTDNGTIRHRYPFNGTKITVYLSLPASGLPESFQIPLRNGSLRAGRRRRQLRRRRPKEKKLQSSVAIIATTSGMPMGTRQARAPARPVKVTAHPSRLPSVRMTRKLLWPFRYQNALHLKTFAVSTNVSF